LAIEKKESGGVKGSDEKEKKAGKGKKKFLLKAWEGEELDLKNRGPGEGGVAVTSVVFKKA